MKIAKVLFKIAHELDKSGRPDLADAADSLAVKLANSPSRYTSVTDIDLTKIPTRPKNAIRDNETQRAVPVGPPAASEAELKEQQRLIDEKKNKSTAVKKRERAEKRARGAARESALNPPPKAIVKPSPAKVDFGRMLEIRDMAQRDRNQITPPLPKRLDTGPDLLKQPAVKSISIQDAASKMRSGPTTSVMNRAKGVTKGLARGVGGLLGGAVGGHAGAAIGEAVGGETGELISGTVGALAGSAAANTPLGRALLAGWVIGTAINKVPGFSDKVQGVMDSILGNADAEQDELQLKGMLDVFNSLKAAVDSQSSPIDARAKKAESLRRLITSIASHPAAKNELAASMTQLGSAIDTTLADLPKAAPGAKAPSKARSLPAIRKLQANLNQLFANSKIVLANKLVVDGIVGRLTRAAISAFDPGSNGRVNRQLLADVAAAAASSAVSVDPPATSPLPLLAP